MEFSGFTVVIIFFLVATPAEFFVTLRQNTITRAIYFSLLHLHALTLPVSLPWLLCQRVELHKKTPLQMRSFVAETFTLSLAANGTLELLSRTEKVDTGKMRSAQLPGIAALITAAASPLFYVSV